MNTLKSVCLSWLVVTGGLAGASGQSSPTNINPALLYYQAFLVTPDLSEADHDFLWTKEWQGQQLPEQFGKIMVGYDNEFRLLRQAARATVPCDWGVDMTEGPATLLPHLARTKAVLLTARFRARWALQQGRQADALEDLVAAFVLGRNVARDGTLVSTLVQQAMEAIDCQSVAELFGQFSTENLQRLLDGLDAAPARRTVADCVATEGAFYRDWMLRRIQELQQTNPGDEAKVMAGIHELFSDMLNSQEKPEDPQPGQTRMSGSTSQVQAGMGPHNDSRNANARERLNQAAGGTSAGVVKLVRELEPFEEQLALALALPHGEFEGRLEQLKAEVQRSSNPLLSLVFPSWEYVRSRELRSLMNLVMVRAAVGYKLRGQAGLQSATDPWGQGPFELQRFVFQGVDRGFELKSACRVNGWQEMMIFVEKVGPPFYVNGKLVGQARPATYPK
jgi:hypothetical protein